ncbi:hypothetical protein F5Y16DRAFT_382676 [Xylariaceae sp. FL0255]|nr:hypothetical protein F5Y16DRAFT_382676 [Xylariaceae sp. FL0255]
MTCHQWITNALLLLCRCYGVEEAVQVPAEVPCNPSDIFLVDGFYSTSYAGEDIADQHGEPEPEQSTAHRIRAFLTMRTSSQITIFQRSSPNLRE